MSKFNEKWFEYVSDILDIDEHCLFEDFIFNDDIKRPIKFIKMTDNLWLFTIESSCESNEQFYPSILKNGEYNTEKYWFKIKNPTLQKINTKLTNMNICKFHINCGKLCDLEMIDSYIQACPICLVEYQKHYLTKTICNHYFCLPCLNLLVEKHRKKLSESDNDWFEINCPLCRQNLCEI